jgi:tetratricopeptide (TPR) repeat protein
MLLTSMRKLATILITFLFLFPHQTRSQKNYKIDSLKHLLEDAKTDKEKVKLSGRLAEYFFVYEDDRAGDSMLQMQYRVAEISGKKDLIIASLFCTAVTNLNNWRSKESFNRALAHMQKALDYARAIGDESHITLAYTRIASLYRKRGQLDNAYYNANNAFTSSLNIKDDSIKILAAIELGDCYQLRGESLMAFKTYIRAFDLSVDIDNTSLQSEVYHRYANLYHSLGNDNLAKEQLVKSRELNEKNKNIEGLINDYIDISRATEERFYVDKALELAYSINSEKYIIYAKRILYGYYAYIIGNSDSTIHYINSNPDLKQVFLNEGTSGFYWRLGSVFHYSSKPDSALYYFNLAKPGLESDFDLNTLQQLYEEMGECYDLINSPKDAIIYYSKALELNNQTNDPVKAAKYSAALSKMYENLHDYENALRYSQRTSILKDSLQKLSNLRDISLIEVSNEKKNHERELERLAQQQITLRNLQYMAITVAITLIFLLMIIIGMFRISRLTIKLLGYFSFISLFEFIVLLIDPFLHRIAHGEPLKIWLMKIVLIAILVPFQHYLEHGMIRFIESRRLHGLREKIGIKKWWQRKKNPSADTIDEIESDTAVL